MRTSWMKRSLGPAFLAMAVVLCGSTAAAAAGPRSAGAAGSVAAAGSLPAAGSAAAAQPAITPILKWGWVNVKRTAMGSYTPAATDRGNSKGKANTVNHYNRGRYEITMKGLGDPGGIVHVSTIGRGDRFCGVELWAPVHARELILVQCRDGSGAYADAKFTVQFVYTNYGPNPFAYALADNTSADYDVVDHTFNNAGGPNHVTRTGPGAYHVTFNGLGGVSEGHVEVTPYVGDYGAGTNAQRGDCTVLSWGSDAGAVNAYVQCFNLAGAPADQRFTITFMQDEGLNGPAAGPDAYLWGNDEADPSYTVNSGYEHSSSGGAIHITRPGVGQYNVRFSGQGSGGTAKVSPYGTAAVHCVIKGIRTSGAPLIVKVRCFTFGGVLADSRFVLAWFK
jgi:hypothetical protein